MSPKIVLGCSSSLAVFKLSFGMTAWTIWFWIASFYLPIIFNLWLCTQEDSRERTEKVLCLASLPSLKDCDVILSSRLLIHNWHIIPARCLCLYSLTLLLEATEIFTTSDSEDLISYSEMQYYNLDDLYHLLDWQNANKINSEHVIHLDLWIYWHFESILPHRTCMNSDCLF